MAESDNDESAGGQTGGNGGSSSELREQDRFLPIANVSRIMKKALPANAKISKEAKETVQECVSEFISFITGEASDKCQKEKRKTINGDDLLWAITTLGFEDYVDPLKLYLLKYRDIEGERMISSTTSLPAAGAGAGRVPPTSAPEQSDGDGAHAIPSPMMMMMPHHHHHGRHMYGSGGSRGSS